MKLWQTILSGSYFLLDLTASLNHKHWKQARTVAEIGKVRKGEVRWVRLQEEAGNL